MVLSKLKESEELKLQLVQLVKGKGLSIAEAARQLDIKVRTAQYFFDKKQAWAKDWWEDNQSIIDDYFKGFNSEWVEDYVDGVKVGKIPRVYAEAPEGSENQQIYQTYQHMIRNVHEAKAKESGTFVYGYWQEDKKPLKIVVVADTQCKPSENLEYMSWIGKYIKDKKPDVVVHIGDNFDFESLSSYDKGKKSFEGRRLKADIEAGNKGLELLTKEFLTDEYRPRMVFCMGNHEHRFDRLAEDMPELDGFVGTETLNLESLGWEVHPFLKPVDISGIYFVHYLANPFTGKPYSGTAMNQLKTVGRSFVVGHKQCLDVALRPTIDGKHQIGIINGAAYPFEERYKGYQGNNHFRGLTVLHEVKDGFGLPMFVSLDYLREKYS